MKRLNKAVAGFHSRGIMKRPDMMSSEQSLKQTQSTLRVSTREAIVATEQANASHIYVHALVTEPSMYMYAILR